ncbi:MAG TPA: phage Gp37/Gp68 family protein [Burkholderiaceae bacterium]|nr:phage Gp37/Gp68 family protein [Burkholderiaceae bacterium]
MANQTDISWCDSTFNPWVGCTKISPACDHCYAERLMDHRLRYVQWGVDQPRKRTSASNWRQPLAWHAAPFFECEFCGMRTNKPMRAQCVGPHRSSHVWKPSRRRVFCASLADVFDNEAPTEWRTDLFALIERTPHLDWLILTKRIGNVERMTMDALRAMFIRADREPPTWPWRNVWLGATICNQEEAYRDIPKLLATPAAVRFLSIEPMLGPVSLRWLAAWPENAPNRAQSPTGLTDHLDGLRRLDWVICGGESGSQARPMHPDWVRALRDQCAAAGVAFHFKQWGEWVPYEHSAQPPYLWSQHCRELDGHALPDFESDDGRAQREWHCDFADQLLARRVGTKAAGRLLDGVEHNGFPASA